MTVLVIIRFIDTLMAGLMAGALWVIWIGYNPKSLSATAYVEQQQSVIKALNTLMPLLGLMVILLTLALAYLQKEDRSVFLILLTAAIFLIISGLVTRFGNQPINSIVMQWEQADIPGEWIALRNTWWSWHIVRTITTLSAFCLIVWANIRKD